MSEERLQKILAHAGIASRRKAEQIILDGRVRVNGQIVRQMGAKADVRADKIEVDGKRIRLPKSWTYILLFKPQGVVTTASDEHQRETVLELIKGVKVRIYPVGRLDMDAEGLLLLTNDGEVADGLTHPSGEIPKTYRAKLRGFPSDADLDKLRKGVILEDGPAKGEDVHRVQMGRKSSESHSWIELTVTEGRNHLIKRMFEAIGYPVTRLRRTKMANLTLDDLKPGKWRHLRKAELHKLKNLARGARRKRKNPTEMDFDLDF